MNYIIDDYGRQVIAVGAPGSTERMKVQYPKLINSLNSLYLQAHNSHFRAIDEALELIRETGIRSKLETTSLLQASHYGRTQDES
jgi:D-arabinose 1-dehydrogenase-like Zn-dependent alcohol dehydrogenase